MPVQFTINSIKHYNEFKNDVGFTANLGDYTNNLTGEVMTNNKVLMSVDIQWFINYAPASGFQWQLSIVGNILTIVSPDGVNFENEGFSVGDILDFIVFTVGFVLIPNVVVTYVNGSTIVIDMMAPFPIPAGIVGISLKGKSDLTALNYKFGLIENGETYNTISKVSGEDQGFYATGVGSGSPRSTTFVPMTKLGSYESWKTGIAQVRFVSYPATYVQRFEIEHSFTIVPYYLDGQLTNLQNKILPTLFTGANTLKYVFNAGFRTLWSYPDSEKTFQLDNISGSVGWFGENFNGAQNDYEVLSIAYEEQATTNAADGLLISSKTKVTVDVQNNAGNFSAGERAGVYVSYLPGQNEYTNTTLTNLKENFLYDNAINNGGVPPVAGQDFITNFEITNIVGNTMTLTFDVEYSLAQKLRLSNLNSISPIYFVIGIQLGDIALSSGATNRLILIGDVELYDVSADIPGLLDFPKMDLYTHERQIGVDVGSTDATDWIEDGLANDYSFRLNLNKDAVLNSLKSLVVAFDPITQIFFVLDTYNFNIFPAVVSSGIQQLNLSTTRGYTLLAGDQFNKVELSVGANAAGFQTYDGIIGQKTPWQEWIENLLVDTVFYDILEPNNNLNNKASNYSLLNGYEIRQGFLASVSGTSNLGVPGITDYLVLTPTLTTYNYEEDGGANIWSHVIETFDATGSTNLGGSILTGQDTLFRSTWTNSGGAVASLVNLWGINRIEETNQPAYDIDELSSINLPPSGQRLIPKGGFTLLDMQIVGGLVVMECLIDGSVVQPNVNYNLSTRIQDDNVAVDGKTTEMGVLKDTEAGAQKTIE